jgi:hypothetical protein
MILNTLEFVHPSPFSRKEEKLSMLHLNVAMSDAGELGFSHIILEVRSGPAPGTDCETVNGRTTWKI